MERLMANAEFKAACRAFEKVFSRLSRPTIHLGTGLIKNPATGTLEPSPALRLKARKAVMREVRSMRYALYFIKASLYLETLRLKGARAILQVRGNFFGKF
jgi:hypothetical protein